MTPQPDKMREAFEKEYGLLENSGDYEMYSQQKAAFRLGFQAALESQWNGPEVDPPIQPETDNHSIDVLAETKSGFFVIGTKWKDEWWVWLDGWRGLDCARWRLLPERKQE